MKKTGLEIVEMIARGEAPKKIKEVETNKEYKYEKERFSYETEEEILRITSRLNEEFEIIEDPKVWRPKYNVMYWYVYNGNIIWTFWQENEFDNLNYAIGNCFRTEEEAKKVLEKLKIYMQLKRYAEEHNEEKIDWNKKWQTKWFICYDFEDKIIISLDTKVIKDIGQVYFTSKRIAEQAIEDIGEENIKKLFEEE